MNKTAILILAAVLILTAIPLRAETYKYTDDRGGLHFVDDLGSVPKKYRKSARTMDDLPALSVMDAQPTVPARPRPSAPVRATAPRENSANSVEVYVTSWCGYCKKALRYLNEKGVSYAVYDIEKDQDANRRHKELGGRGVPLIKIGANKVRGFDPEEIDRYLRQ
ncbi:putative glutaredoxin-like 8.6 kDa protein in rubredoxin operon [Geobacter sp. OR-1]|uniref:glutaredoxin domain-containing protein n=1 Tax=Geobacter sp. OR-1 TaxID=1266765 RepID=UPI000542B9FB|nr:glutaredoxin domain-containing protein [Geobacter sp. OR-1]GAM09583.1 putative glutaredoxin-like 8.6 kDa protein in rubredoxin operon [Geobacter sp. OR-1]